MRESSETKSDLRMKVDLDSTYELLKVALDVECEDKDIKRVIRLGKRQENDRPLLVEFRDRNIKNRVMETLGKLKVAEEKYRTLSITHDMTKAEREECRCLIAEAKSKEEQQEHPGEFIFRVRGPPSNMKILRFRVQ